MSYNTLWQKMSLQYIDAIKKASGSDYKPLMYLAEFDDALVDAAHWKNPRYAGSKLIGKKINEYNGMDTPEQFGVGTATIGGPGSQATFIVGQFPFFDHWEGDITYGLNPVINNETTAIYIANTVVGGTEKPKTFATLENHSYVNINKILIVRTEDNTVQVIDRETEPYDSFHRFVTSDFPTGGKLNIKVLDPSIQSNLEGNYRCRMNKGWLLSTFKYLDYANDNSLLIFGSVAPPAGTATWDNPLELFDNSDMGSTGVSSIVDNLIVLDTPRLSFRFGYKADDDKTTAWPNYTGNSVGALVFATATTQNPGGSFVPNVTVPHRDFSPSYVGATIVPNKFTRQYYSGSFTFPADNIGYDGAFFSASRFILNDTMNYLINNFEKTELHLTINKGTKDFAPDFGDERSIGTFEVDRGYGNISTLGRNDETDGSSHMVDALGNPGGYIGHNTPIHHILQLKGGTIYTPTGTGVTQTLNHVCLFDANTESNIVRLPHTRRTYWSGNESPALPYSGSAAFELSFLNKDHTLIVNVDKDTELFEGIGTKGIALIPEHLHGTIKKNLEYYLEKAGIIENATNLKA